MTTTEPTSAEIERVYRDVSGSAVATLVRMFGDLGLAEDAVHDAFVVAARRWADDGIPPNPAGWIVTTAKRRAIDHRRREARRSELMHHVDVDSDDIDLSVEIVDDDRLRLIFTCCHPAIATEHRVALTLRLLGGLSVDQIADAFLVSPAAMARRITRTKYKIAASSIPYRVPDRRDLPERLHGVLLTLSLIYTAGTDDLVGGEILRSEAIRLARAVSSLLPDQPETQGLLALLILNEARTPARLGARDPVLLGDQDRSLWTHDLVAEGHDLVRACVRLDQPGPFQLQAAIQAVHTAAPTASHTDWPKIVALYDHLFDFLPTPVVAMNRAIAVGELDGPDRALALLDALSGALGEHARFHAARATLLTSAQRHDEAAEAFRAAERTSSGDARRRYSALADEIQR